MMPKMDGFQLATYIREVNSQIPIIFVTAKSLQEDKIKGLQIGADDYITKPFSIEELVLKINVFLKRKFINDHSTDPNLQVGKFTLDMKNLRLVKEGLPQKITQREGELLEVLASHKNEIVKRKLLLERIWGKEDYFLGRSMDVFISRLRKHLSGDPKVVIENVHGVGFRLTDQ
jgi:DNA-binding response OmpR family regulator